MANYIEFKYIELTPGVSIVNTTCQALVNTVNCDGIMGKGVALAVKERWPEVMNAYQELHRKGKLLPGQVYRDTMPDGKIILNATTKCHWRDPSEYDWIISILEIMVKRLKNSAIKSLAIPPLGCGNGGLSWPVVGPIIQSHLWQTEMQRVEIYIPKGLCKYHLMAEPDLPHQDLIDMFL